MADIELTQESALDLPLAGSLGHFKVVQEDTNQRSISTKYLLTHVGLDLDGVNGAQNDRLLRNLAPVREVFHLHELDFDEIMQRDIDDSRVSDELIPYLLDYESPDLLKLFPPIIVVVLPVDNHGKPVRYYPTLHRDTESAGQAGVETYIERSGVVGQEVFQFEQPVVAGQHYEHDRVRLKLNTSKTKLVIVDGQHRAMALLALYRNQRQDWSDAKRKPYERFYKQWDPEKLEKVDLDAVKLPVMFCTFPDLDESFRGDFDLLQASRAVFLTLNKNARPVTRSRNILLNDNDIIASTLRRTLSELKAKAESSHEVDISAVELDQPSDKMRISAHLAITGVNHLYFALERLLLNQSEDIDGMRTKSAKYGKRRDLDFYGFNDRLKMEDLVESTELAAADRAFYSIRYESAVHTAFMEVYGVATLRFLTGFHPFHIHHKETLNLRHEVEQHANATIKTIFFEGQGIGRVFDSHRQHLKSQIREHVMHPFWSNDVGDFVRELDGTAAEVKRVYENFQQRRAQAYLSDAVTTRLKSDASIISFVNDLYANVLTTVAFQTAVLSTFFGMAEQLSAPMAKDQLLEEFEGYLASITAFFVPSSKGSFKNLLRVFRGDLREQGDAVQIVPRNDTFRAIVFPGEMKPDEWPRYKFLIAEVWRTDNPVLLSVIEGERATMRAQALANHLDRKLGDYAAENAINVAEISQSRLKSILNDSVKELRALLKNLGADVSALHNEQLIQESSKYSRSELPDLDEEEEE